MNAFTCIEKYVYMSKYDTHIQTCIVLQISRKTEIELIPKGKLNEKVQ